MDMQSNLANRNAVAAIRVSTEKQGRDGDSPEAQKEQIMRFAESKGIHIKEFFVFLESASKELQPMQQVVDYCTNPKNNVDLFIIKSIDRFTRGGSFSYDQMKMQLDQAHISLVDIYGVISSEKVNTLDHLGFEYKWSVYSPSKKSEILEAERSKDELRDIMSRMIGAEIRYTQLGYWMRQPPYGFVSEKVESKNGKRCVLKPHPTEAEFIRQMFELRARGTMHDEEIVAEINKQGFKTRVRTHRDKTDRSKVTKVFGGDLLTVKAMQKLMRNTVYAGINQEKWTDGKPVRCVFDGLVSIEQFNVANKGKIAIEEDATGVISIYKKRPPEHLVNKGRRNPDFAYRKFILCTECQRPFLGSASRGKSGKYYPAYHCTKHGHTLRVPKAQLDAAVESFVTNLVVCEQAVEDVMSVIEAAWKKRQEMTERVASGLDERIMQLQTEVGQSVAKLKMLNSETAIKYMEEDLMKIEKQIKQLQDEKVNQVIQERPDMDKVFKRVRQLVAHPQEVFRKQIDPVKKAQLFALFFEKLPTYDDLLGGTPKTPLFTGVHPIFKLARLEKSLMVISRRIELRLPG
jgi:site-specific DNA recombinase